MRQRKGDQINDDNRLPNSIRITVFIIVEITLISALLMGTNIVSSWRYAAMVGGLDSAGRFVAYFIASPFLFTLIVLLTLDEPLSNTQARLQWLYYLRIGVSVLFGSTILGYLSYSFAWTFWRDFDFRLEPM